MRSAIDLVSYKLILPIPLHRSCSVQNQSSNNPNRRDFLKTSSLITGGLLAGMTATSRFVHAKETNELKVALIGCGGRVRCDHRYDEQPAIQSSLWAMADIAFGSRRARTIQYRQRTLAQMDVPPERRFSGFDAYQKGDRLRCRYR